jgi:murein DD-endopeptidase MepM/ murein hydrolase activator NlpD
VSSRLAPTAIYGGLASGRAFLSGDPLVQDPVNGQGYNRYTYVYNNPTNLTDPTGFAACTGSRIDSGSCGGYNVKLAEGYPQKADAPTAERGSADGSKKDSSGANRPDPKKPAPNNGSTPTIAAGGGTVSNQSQIAGSDGTGAQRKEKWPVPGHFDINEKDKPGEGDGHFDTPRTPPRRHTGLDIKAPVGADVVAVSSGIVVNIQPNPSKSYGNQVVVDHGEGVYSQSAHLDSVTVKPGQKVTAGEMIGTVGRTGNPPKFGDSHLHFEIRLNSPRPQTDRGTVDDPLKYLPIAVP